MCVINKAGRINVSGRKIRSMLIHQYTCNNISETWLKHENLLNLKAQNTVSQKYEHLYEDTSEYNNSNKTVAILGM
jgi:hypothetical protein